MATPAIAAGMRLSTLACSSSWQWFSHQDGLVNQSSVQEMMMSLKPRSLPPIDTTMAVTSLAAATAASWPACGAQPFWEAPPLVARKMFWVTAISDMSDFSRRRTALVDDTP